MAEVVHNTFFWLLFKLILLLGVSFHCIIWFINPLHDVSDVGKYWFAIYHPDYKDKYVNNSTRALICAIDNLYFLFNFGNFLASLRKKNCQELSYIFFLNLTLSKMRLTMFEYLVISKCTAITKWQLNLTLTDFITKAYALLILKTKHFKIVRTGKYKIDKYEMGKYRYQAILEKVANVAI